MKERFSIRAAVYLLLFRDGKVLLSHRFNTGWQDGKYSLIAGHIDGNETVADAMIREAKEEAGIAIAREDMRVIHTMHRKSKDAEYIDFFLTAEKWKGELKNNEPQKCDELGWFPVEELPDTTLSYIAEVIRCVGNGVTFSESGWSGDAL